MRLKLCSFPELWCLPWFLRSIEAAGLWPQAFRDALHHNDSQRSAKEVLWWTCRSKKSLSLTVGRAMTKTERVVVRE